MRGDIERSACFFDLISKRMEYVSLVVVCSLHFNEKR